MSEEEKKAIANFKYWIDTNTERGICYLPDYICAKVLNLIEKQQKEIKELKKENVEIRGWKYTIDTIEDLDKLKELDLIKIKGKEYISKDKIREKIEMLENELRKNNENIEYTRKLIYTADETIKKEIQDLEKLLVE